MYLEFNNNNGHLKRLTHTGPKRLHILKMYLESKDNNNNENRNNNNNGYFERLTRTEPKRLHSLEMYLEFNINNNNNNEYSEPLTRTDPKCLRILYDVLGV